MDSLAKKIADAIGKYHTGFMQKKVLKTIEEIEATTDTLEKYVAGAEAVDELNNNLMSRPEFITDENGKITGYKTSGGADTVFPFSSLPETATILNWTWPSGYYSGSFTITGFIPKGYKKVFVNISNGTINNGQGVNTCVVGGKTLGYGTHTIDDSFEELEGGGYKVTYSPVYCAQGGGMLTTLKIDAML